VAFRQALLLFALSQACASTAVCSNVQVFKTIGVPAVKLLLIPGLVEAFFNGGLAVALFGMTPLFGFALGFILKAVGPALVIQLMFELQQKRLGAERSKSGLLHCFRVAV
jgi:NhaP-type Na+/H+ or K+/H+ antiporter